MKKIKLLALLMLTIPSLTHTTEQDDMQSQADTTSHQLSRLQRYIRKTMRSFNPSSDLTGNLQTLTNNRIKVILQKMRFQQVELLAALSKNNDLLIQSLSDPNDQQNARALLVMSKEILSLITGLNTFITQTSTQINQ